MEQAGRRRKIATTELAEIGENATSKANFDESMSIVEPQDPLQVTANHGDPAGLDKGQLSPRTQASRATRRCKAGRSKIENRKLKMATASRSSMPLASRNKGKSEPDG